ncbi:shufflon system plasmid conjugative transfer pilus tip adhesin PilV [Serratia marcescens]|jgi:Tfp pilus assembly major pilin PilA|uniref:shufflon system plasmid conjugative transfer pilus tip adhesin PilV n=1 Tax=Serratia TaxID=613 RepID=UPI00217AC9A0|nr:MULTISPECIES: shufflon system plasmid conjugative transfer pilus tip adhesin PilV [Serratia]MDP8737019.1 shufflon system plasmid conjugative transfer pilus tip adhesin PilV [Serratia marcescens]MDU4176541.1 shufflon system plasmid conjugative transfer pilus tip adhesin PilV [Serratia liquefaciens]CAI2003924.1 Tfp pilus assembly protein PilE [Serratia liquefaciens]CAI2011915.1 Tfp pilus assembly protein PilE [Serratia liquefaciens]CAI2018688.1 Tfp pilus assembly protein PilE [Serratia marces
MTAEIANPRINRGMSLISMAIVLGIVLIAAPIGLERYSNYIEEQTWVVTATHLSTVSQGARRYVKDNYDALLNQVKGGGNVTVTGQTLRDKGYLPAGFSLTNNNAQTYILAVTRNPAQTDKLVAFVLTAGGQNIAFKGQRYIAQNTSGLGGYIEPVNVANGAGGGWQVNLSNLGLSGQSGHLAAYLTSDVLAGGAEESDRLYRFQVNGRPDLNKMHTAIDMGANDLHNANIVDANTGNFKQNVNGQNVYASADMSANRISSNTSVWAGGWIGAVGDVRSDTGWLISKHGKGWLNEDHGGGFYMDDNDWIRSVNNKGIYTGGQLKGGTVRADGRASVGEYLQLDGTANAGWGCSPNGLVGRTPEGILLSCQNGIWKSLGALDTFNVTSDEQCQNLKEARAYCPAGTKLVSGGYRLSRWTASDAAHNSPDAAYPDIFSNSWIVVTPNNEWRTTCFQAIAICTK